MLVNSRGFNPMRKNFCLICPLAVTVSSSLKWHLKFLTMAVNDEVEFKGVYEFEQDHFAWSTGLMGSSFITATKAAVCAGKSGWAALRMICIVMLLNRK